MPGQNDPSLPTVKTNPHWLGYRCTLCGRSFGIDWSGFVCQDCGIDGILDVRYDYAAIGAGLDPGHPFGPPPAADLWRFAPLLPIVPETDHPAWSVGATRLWRARRLESRLSVAELWLKDDTCLPSASLKDRAAAVAIADAVRLGVDHAACASTGNAAASLAVLAARAGLPCTIFVPATAPTAKLAQLLLHGAEVVRVDGSYDQAFELSLRVITRNGWYSRNCAHNPLLVEGKKTAALEIAAALDWNPPDAVFVPVGDGCIVSSVGKAFAELVQLGLCPRSPRIYGVQAAGAAPLFRAWEAVGARADKLTGPEILAAVRPLVADTCADSLAVGLPRNRLKAWRAVAESGGSFLAVTDPEIVAATRLLAAEAGLFAEPAGAAGVAGLLQAVKTGTIKSAERVAVLVTGHGLKDPAAALAGISLPEPVAPDGPLSF